MTPFTDPFPGPRFGSGNEPHAGAASFTEYLRGTAPHLLPGADAASLTPVAARGTEAVPGPPHGTTIVAASFEGGVAIAGDRRATSGNLIASNDIQKVYLTDRYSAVGIAGTAGLAVELVKLFVVELEHFEKVEGVPLSLVGKANRLATMLRSQMPMAMRGLAVLPVFVAVDHVNPGPGRIFTYDVTGGCYEEHDHHSIGSGSMFARGSMKKLWRPDLDADHVVRVLVEALADAADDDSATGGPDLARGIWPSCAVITADGAEMVSDARMEDVVNTVIAQRRADREGRR